MTIWPHYENMVGFEAAALFGLDLITTAELFSPMRGRSRNNLPSVIEDIEKVLNGQ